jgi:hypothetical protein
MKKLNGFESMLVIQGLAEVRKSMRNEIIEIEAQGKNAIMTVGYVDMIIDEAIEKIKSLTLKQK